MLDLALDFLKRQSSLIITTHDPSDPDGLGAEKVMYLVANTLGIKSRIINSNPVPEKYNFIDVDNTIEIYRDVKETISKDSALVILDTSDDYNIGEIREILSLVKEVFIIDHHEPNKFCNYKGLIDPKASASSELMVEIAQAAGIKLSPEFAKAAYAGIVFDTGFLAYPKTTARTFESALTLIKAGVIPYEIYHELRENTSIGTLLLQKAVLSTLELHNKGRIAVQLLRKRDFDNFGGSYEDSERFVSTPMECRDIEVSILVKENKEGNVRCSLRSKGKVNVSKLAQDMGGGGHATAAGFKSTLNLEETMEAILKKVSEALEEK